MNFESIKLSDEFVKEQFIDTNFVENFAELTGDNNPIHLDEEFAKNSIFGQRIIHGLIVGSIFSRIIASDFPGPGSIYLHQDLDFLRPIFHNSNLQIKFRVLSLKQEKKIVKIETLCIVDGQIAVKGIAVVKCLN